LAIGRDRHAVTPALIGAIPEFFARDDVHRHHAIDIADVHLAGGRAGGEALDVFDGLPLLVFQGREAFDEFVTLIDIEHQDADATPFGVIADAGTGDVQI